MGLYPFPQHSSQSEKAVPPVNPNNPHRLVLNHIPREVNLTFSLNKSLKFLLSSFFNRSSLKIITTSHKQKQRLGDTSCTQWDNVSYLFPYQVDVYQRKDRNS